jgi:hypothetical protein
MELPLHFFDKGKEEFLELRFKKVHIIMVNFRRNMVRRSILEFSQTSHTPLYGLVVEFAWLLTSIFFK